MAAPEVPLDPKIDRPLVPGRARLPLDLPIALDRAAGEALHRQIARGLRAAILAGQAPPGALLPSTRDLAATLGVTRGVVLAAYEDLAAEGYVEARHGAGTRVAPDFAPPAEGAPPPPGPPPARRWARPAPPDPTTDRPRESHLLEFRLGQPSVRELDLGAWRRAWREAAHAPPPDDYGPAEGEPELRAALAAFLTRSRGLPTRPEEVLVTSGAVQGLGLLARAALRPGDRVAIEEPGYRLARDVLRDRGVELVPVPVDEDGLRVAELPTGPGAPVLLCCTPSHQYPLGSRLSVARRHALLEWARAHDALILEDDYDSEFRFGAPPLPTLRSLDLGDQGGGRVVYLGTLSKVLMPGLRLGYVVAPPDLLARLAREKTLADIHAPWPVQRAVAAFLAGGHLDRHIRRMRRVYAAKRALLAAELAPVAPLARLGGTPAGLHAPLVLAPPLRADAVAAEAERRGVRVTTSASYYLGPVPREELLLGYGALTPDEIRRGAAVVRDVVREMAGTMPG